MAKLAVLILAAGNSSRMGVPKQLLKWKESNLLQHTINTVNELNTENILVLGAHFNKIKPSIHSGNMVVLFNESWEKGLSHSIVIGVNHIKESLPNMDGILIMLADQPLIDSNYLNEMINLHHQNPNKIICTMYQNGKRGVPAIFNKTYFEDLLQLNDDKGAKELLIKHSKNLILLNGIKHTTDIDTMNDYEMLYKLHH
ncbi:MAG: nucleotidyltransferase family protein [Flavobacteriales bacterium]|nr:nucleotidyltransferase family protein [Flavobacteriia bacterium]NCP05291.1 nucleotidyltransferase family protein [Flavobacteriales bacterium]PIV95068.1 MAG: hypothetical protein COW44_00835 [Flavobacteriaceae bacterium CG17_big_fil_post_rev_8_21_14_2_50_33_15]PIY09292.1 MAG: hypothetical protein COZ17_13505 [Flavobacteriaceae bacterium CG_4_10_14_3_um_filter_33_47]PJB20266.1 MAG: hypothetical protein CO117_01565 [Flavobacteriaceae bacterium CG_4_9_14_3_um_filter_33_16]